MKDEAILIELKLKPTRYYQLLNAIIDKPEAIAAMPELVIRLQRLRASCRCSSGSGFRSEVTALPHVCPTGLGGRRD